MEYRDYRRIDGGLKDLEEKIVKLRTELRAKYGRVVTPGETKFLCCCCLVTLSTDKNSPTTEPQELVLHQPRNSFNDDPEYVNWDGDGAWTRT